jgi:hypothetical protein
MATNVAQYIPTIALFAIGGASVIALWLAFGAYRKAHSQPQPNYRQSVRWHLWGWVRGLFGRKQS